MSQYFPLVRMTPADAEVWDYWLAFRKPRLRSALLSNSLASDAEDFALMQVAQQYKKCVVHWASWRTSGVLLRGFR